MEAGNPVDQRSDCVDNPQLIPLNNSRPDHPLPPPSPPQYLGDQVHKRHLDQLAMAAATVLPPSSHYQSQQSSYPSGYLQQPPIMLSSEQPPPPRRSSDESDSSNRQSLPSISEVISGTRPGQYPPPPARPCLPSAGTTSLHSPFIPVAARQYPEAEKHPSPHASSAFVHRPDPLPPFSTGSPRPPFSGRPSLPPVTDRRLTPPTKHEVLPPRPSHIPESQKPSEPHPLNGSYGPQPPPAHIPVQYQPGQLPPGQQPLPSYPVSPRHAPSHGPGPYDSRAPPPSLHDDQDYVSRSRHDSTAARIAEGGSYREALGRIGASSRTVFNFAEAYGRLAREQHGSQPIPDRLPTEREVGEMLSNVEYLKNSLEHIREIVLVSIQSERLREDIKRGYEEDPDVHMYSDSVKPHYMAEVKKRRGRAAPPGRCHSCNRIDTPEWRRGPDGARTLCNACGLHYAKLERKRQIEARSTMRPTDDRI